MDLIALAIPFFLLAIAVELLVARRKRVAVYRLGDAVASLGCGIAMQLVSFTVGAATTVLVYSTAYQWRMFDWPQPWMAWVFAFLAYEFLYYWWHRLSHEVNILWAAHVVHHQSQDMNLAVALRQSVTTWITFLPFALPLALFGVPLRVFAVIGAFNLLYQFWIHTELIPPLGVLEKIFNTPALHRVHHAVNARYIDKNHGGTFAIFDRVFGTYEPETERCRYGTTLPLQSYNPWWAQVDSYVALWRMSVAHRSLRVWFASPGDKRWALPNLAPPPADKYDPPASASVQRYVLLQWLGVLAATTVLLMFGKAWPAARSAPWVVLISLSLLSLPALIEGRRWARPLEAVRLVGILALAIYSQGRG